MSERDRRLAEKYAAQGRESASQRAARKEQEKAARRNKTAPAVPPPSRKDLRGRGVSPVREGRFPQDAADWYDQYRDTPKSRRRRQAHRKSPSADAQGGGESFADRSARSITAWFGFGR